MSDFTELAAAVESIDLAMHDPCRFMVGFRLENAKVIVRDVPRLIERVERAEAERDRLAKALSWYAIELAGSDGDVAREALAGEEQP